MVIIVPRYWYYDTTKREQLTHLNGLFDQTAIGTMHLWTYQWGSFTQCEVTINSGYIEPSRMSVGANRLSVWVGCVNKLCLCDRVTMETKALSAHMQVFLHFTAASFII